MRRYKLSAIEIAEGALLADIAVIFQLLWMFVPLAGELFRLLIPMLFTVLVLRRNLYAGAISLCVPVFIASVVTGPNVVSLIYVMLEGIGGLFLGVMMKHRARDLPILLLGTTGLAVALYALVFVLALLFGTPLAEIIHSLHHHYAQVVAAVGSAASHVGLAGVWQGAISPALTRVADFAFAYWLALLFVYCWAVSLPVNLVMYGLTNLLMRWLQYDVRPFPSGKLSRLMRWTTRRLVRRGVRWGILRRRGAIA